MQKTLDLAHQAADQGEVPVAALIVDLHLDKCIAQACNRMQADKNPLAHAEMLVINEACRGMARPRLHGLCLFVNLEPCPMCAAAISLAHLDELIFAAFDVKSGGVENGPRILCHPTSHHKPKIISGIKEQQSRILLQDFFAKRR